jgi:hypothetical protein
MKRTRIEGREKGVEIWVRCVVGWLVVDGEAFIKEVDAEESKPTTRCKCLVELGMTP